MTISRLALLSQLVLVGLLGQALICPSYSATYAETADPLPAEECKSAEGAHRAAAILAVAPSVAAIPAPTDTLALSALCDPEALKRMLERAEELTPLSSLLVARQGELVVEKYYRGMRADRTVNVKSISKALLSPLIGIAIRDGLLEGVDQRLDELLPEPFDELEAAGRLDPRKRRITLHHVLSMAAGIQTTSFGNYGAWVTSGDWVRDALRRPMVCDPGRCFEYSTGNTHLLSAILTRRSGKSLRAYAKEALFDPLGIPVYAWDRDPQGTYLGGNNMALRPRDLLRFGQLFLDGGRHEGRQLVPKEWIATSWRPWMATPWYGHRYGYLWWIDRWGRETAYFAWGYGGQYLVLVPRLDVVVVITSSPAGRQWGHTRRLHGFLDQYVVPAFTTRASGPKG